MKHGLHIMLQRFVRSTVRTAPRPNCMLDVPCLCTCVSSAERKSRPKKSDSMRSRKRASVAIRSRNSPCLGQVLVMKTCPSSSKICAFISPGCAFIRSSSGVAPEMTPSRTSLTQRGHRESVSRGKPSGGLVRSYDLRSGPGAHFGRIASPSGSRRLTDWKAFHATSDRFEISFEVLTPLKRPLSDSPRRNWSLNKCPVLLKYLCEKALTL